MLGYIIYLALISSGEEYQSEASEFKRIGQELSGQDWNPYSMSNAKGIVDQDSLNRWGSEEEGAAGMAKQGGALANEHLARMPGGVVKIRISILAKIILKTEGIILI